MQSHILGGFIMMHMIKATSGLVITHVGHMIGYSDFKNHLSNIISRSKKIICNVQNGSQYGVLSIYVQNITEDDRKLFNALSKALNSNVMSAMAKTFNLITYTEDGEQVVIRSVKFTHVTEIGNDGVSINFNCKFQRVSELREFDKVNMKKYL